MFGDLPSRVFTTRDLPRPETATFEFRQGPVGDHDAEIRALAGDGRPFFLAGLRAVYAPSRFGAWPAMASITRSTVVVNESSTSSGRPKPPLSSRWTKP